ncbi:hypothetical protein NEMBOFW57_006763 [Staphylotrichum longicolle]|uniref:Uncharacterized protein n=1 Tax=Staphylotrichum longicolle TaxID=669026 RepID=A0AAD4ETS3_9PEZI|nr:hypothetical protein NEMBOFW57_006763 [Staphylotrichum longicolle]
METPGATLAIPSSTPAASAAATQGFGAQEQPQSTRPSADSDRSVYCDAVQTQDSSLSDAETQPPHSSSAASATTVTPATTVPDDAWNYSEPVPGSKKQKLIFYKAPFEWCHWTREQWLERFVFVKDKLESLVYEHLRLVDFTNRPVFSPRMVGTCRSEARPAVVVTCRDADFRNIRNLFQARAEKPLGLGRCPLGPDARHVGV